MTALLRILPPRRRQYRAGRRATPTGCIVVHTAETTPDFTPPDNAAENVAKFIQARTDPGSYHRLVDSDSIINLVEFRDEAFHDGTGSNRWSIGLSFATFAASWSTAPDWWVERALEMGAAAAAEANDWLVANGYPGCPARRISRAESEAGLPGFISHGERDPGRRSDPGPDFPWTRFLTLYDNLINPPVNAPEGDHMLKDFIDHAFLATRGTWPDTGGYVYWWQTANAEAPDRAAWTYQDCLDSPTLSLMVALLLKEQK